MLPESDGDQTIENVTTDSDTTIVARFNVQNASIRTLRVELPVDGEDEIKTVRANGGQVSDLVRVEGEEKLWEIQFKRRVVGNVL